jgi:hypothetical protein
MKKGSNYTILVPKRAQDYSDFNWQDSQNSPTVLFMDKNNSSNLVKLFTLMRFAIKSQSQNEKHSITFSAIDDYYKELVILAPFFWAFSKKQKVHLIQYRAEYMLDRWGFRSLLKRLVFNWICFFLNPKTIGFFDERIIQLNPDKFRHLGDPAPDIFFENFQLAPNRQTNQEILIVGKLDHRKGASLILDWLEQSKSSAHGLHCKIIVTGQAGNRKLIKKLRVNPDYSKRIVFENRWLTDLELREKIDGTNLVLLPYHKSHSSTSGILARASARRVPVLASNHGLIGWRTDFYNLGQTFSYKKLADFEIKLAEESLKSKLQNVNPIFLKLSTEEYAQTTFDALFLDDASSEQ